jgi:hypothetical protein
VPGRATYSPYSVYYNRFWGYYTTLNTRIDMPGYYQENTRYFWESNFYELSSRQLIYSVQTESFDPASSESLAHQHGQIIVKDMVKKKVLADSAQIAVKKGF